MKARYITVFCFFILLLPMLPMHTGYASPTILSVDPPDSYVTLGKTLNVTINVADVVNLTCWQFTLYFSNTILSCTNAIEGPFLKTSGGSTYFSKTINNTVGRVLVYCSLLGDYSASGSGILTTISFNALNVGNTTLHLNETSLGDEEIPPQTIPHTTVDGTAHVQAYTLTVTPVGSGSVSLNNTGPYYHYGEAVVLTAVPAIGWSFGSWSGNLTGSINPATLVFTGNMSVTATFTQNQYTLTVIIIGSGSVSKNPDQPSYTWGSNVTLNATASLGWTFYGWTGGASGSTNPVVVNVTSNMSVTATFTQNTYTLNVTIIGSGSVNLNNSGPYYYGDIVQLTADAATGWSFDHWSGDLSGPTNPTTILVDGNKTVTATFTQNVYALTTSVIGSGSVNRNNTGPYHYGDTVELTAVPSPGWSFDHWSGDLTGSLNPNTLLITGNMTVTATFTQNIYTLIINTVGSGSVNLNNTGPYRYGDVVQLTANPGVGWSFEYWSGDVTGSANPTTILINGNKVATATFTQNVYNLTVNIVGNGIVNLNDSVPYHYGDVVEFTAVAGVGWSFDHWSGDLSGSVNPTILVIDGNKVVTATFTQNTYILTVSVIGNGSVNLNNSGPYHYGDVVQLSAVPDPGWVFNHWSGDLTGYANPAILSVDDNKTVTATFIEVGAEIHEVTITNVTTSKQGCLPLPNVCIGFTCRIFITVENSGNFTETISIHAYVNYTLGGEFLVGTDTVTLNAGDSTVITLVWNTTGFATGNYTIHGLIDPVPMEANISDNVLYNGSILITIVGDITGPAGRPDGKVDMFDVGNVARRFTARPPSPDYNKNMDINDDGVIDMRDIAVVAKHFGEHV